MITSQNGGEVGGSSEVGSGVVSKTEGVREKRGVLLLIFTTQLIDVTSAQNASFYCVGGDVVVVMLIAMITLIVSVKFEF